MARSKFNIDHDFSTDRSTFKATDAKPANTNSPPQKPGIETSEFDLDNVFEEPSRRPI